MTNEVLIVDRVPVSGAYEHHRGQDEQGKAKEHEVNALPEAKKRRQKRNAGSQRDDHSGNRELAEQKQRHILWRNEVGQRHHSAGIVMRGEKELGRLRISKDEVAPANPRLLLI